jgi:hypothetical protein
MNTRPTLELTQWLRDNSSGVYRPAAEAADLIEQLERERDEARKAAEEWRSTAGDVAAMPIIEHLFSWENSLLTSTSAEYDAD